MPVNKQPIEPTADLEYEAHANDYGTFLNYDIEDEHRTGEGSTTGMIRGALLQQNQQQQYLDDDVPQYITDDEYEYEDSDA